MEFATALQPTGNVITLEVATVFTDVLVLYYMAGAHGFLAIEIIGGFVRLSFALSDGSVTRIVGVKAVSDGQWHRVEIQRSTTVSRRMSQNTVILSL